MYVPSVLCNTVFFSSLVFFQAGPAKQIFVEYSIGENQNKGVAVYLYQIFSLFRSLFESIIFFTKVLKLLLEECTFVLSCLINKMSFIKRIYVQIKVTSSLNFVLYTCTEM